MARSFADILPELEGGDALNDFSESIERLTERVRETGKPGAVSLKITVAPNGDNSVELSVALAEKLPEGKRPKNIFFVDENNGLRREDPRQSRFELRPVDMPRMADNA